MSKREQIQHLSDLIEDAFYAGRFQEDDRDNSKDWWRAALCVFDHFGMMELKDELIIDDPFSGIDRAERPAGEAKCECPCHKGGAPMHAAMGMDFACERRFLGTSHPPVAAQPEVTTVHVLTWLRNLAAASVDNDGAPIDWGSLTNAAREDIRANLARQAEAHARELADLKRQLSTATKTTENT
jgi:hypothetical protein